MTTEKSAKRNPWDNAPIPERTQESVFGTGNGANNSNHPFKTVEAKPIEHNIDAIIESGNRPVLIPPGHEVIIYKKSFSPNLIHELDLLTTSIQALKPVESQDDVVAQNTVLKNASRFMKRFEEERKAMAEPVKSVDAELLQFQKTTLATISNLVENKNTEIVNFQKAEAKRIADQEAEIKKQRDAEILAAQKENQRKQNILNLLAQFENNVMHQVSIATIDTVDNIIKGYDLFKIKEESYQEYTSQAIELQKNLRVRLVNRKAELEKIAELEKTNALQAEQLRLQQEQQVENEKQAAAERIKQQQEEANEQAQSDIANAQMQAEFHSSHIPTQKNVMKKWTFDSANVDIAALPLEYHTFDESKIQAAINAGARNIPGVVIEQKISNVKK